jgi:hypothetical protein
MQHPIITVFFGVLGNHIRPVRKPARSAVVNRSEAD